MQPHPFTKRDWSGGYNLYASPADLKENESQRIDDGMIAQPLGKLVKRYGFAKYVSTQISNNAPLFVHEYYVDNLATAETPADGQNLIVLRQGATASDYSVLRWNGTAWTELTTAGQRNASYYPCETVHNETLRYEFGPLTNNDLILPNLWYGLIDRSYWYGVAVAYNGRYVSSASMIPLSYCTDAADTSSADGAGGGNPGALDVNCQVFNSTAGTTFPRSTYRFSYEYDGFQCTPFVRVNTNADIGFDGPVCQSTSPAASAILDDVTLRVRVRSAAWVVGNNSHESITEFNKRITAIYVWRAPETLDDTDANYRLLRRIPITETDAILGSNWTTTAVTVEVTAGTTTENYFQFQLTDDFTDAELIEAGYGQFYADFIGHSGGDDRLNCGVSFIHKGIRFGLITSKGLDLTPTNLAPGTADYFDIVRDDRLYYNPLQNTTDPPSYATDSFPAELFLNISQGDGDTLVGGVDDGTQVLLWKRNNVFRVNVSAEDVTASQIIKVEGEGRGAVAHRTIIKTSVGWVYLTEHTVGLYANGRCYDVGKAIATDAKPGTVATTRSLAGFTTAEKEAAFACYDAVNDEYMLFLYDVSETRMYCFVKSFRETFTGWMRYRYKDASVFRFTDAVNPHTLYQELVAVDTTNKYIQQLNSGTTDDGATINLDWTDRMLTGPTDLDELVLNTIGITHKSSAALNVGINVDGAAIDMDPDAAGNLVSFSAHTVLRPGILELPTEAAGGQMEMTMNATGTVEIDSITVLTKVRQNRRRD